MSEAFKMYYERNEPKYRYPVLVGYRLLNKWVQRMGDESVLYIKLATRFHGTLITAVLSTMHSKYFIHHQTCASVEMRLHDAFEQRFMVFPVSRTMSCIYDRQRLAGAEYASVRRLLLEADF